jgi:hypothetical protein
VVKKRTACVRMALREAIAMTVAVKYVPVGTALLTFGL